MDSSSKTKSFFSLQCPSSQSSCKRGFQKHSIISHKGTYFYPFNPLIRALFSIGVEVPPSIYSNQKKTIRKTPKITTPSTKQLNENAPRVASLKMSSHHKKRLNFEFEEQTHKKSARNSPVDHYQTAVVTKRDSRMEIEDGAK